MRGTFEEPPTGLIPWFSKTEGNTYATIAASPFPLQGKPTQAQDVAVYLPSYKFPIYFTLQSLLSIFIIKNTKNIYLIISIRSHFCKLPWRDWQPLYCVGCEVLVCLCRCVGLLRSLLLDLYLGSQKLREILTLLCCITLSSSRKANASSRRSRLLFKLAPCGFHH